MKRRKEIQLHKQRRLRKYATRRKPTNVPYKVTPEEEDATEEKENLKDISDEENIERTHYTSIWIIPLNIYGCLS